VLGATITNTNAKNTANATNGHKAR
jgi:hypothetical protein